MTAKEEILDLLESLPDAPTYADAFDCLRPLYNREVAPIISQYGNPPRPLGHWRRAITGRVEVEEQKQVRTTKSDLVHLMEHLPSIASVPETVDEAMYKLFLSYRIDLGEKQIVEGMGIPHAEVRQRLSLLRKEIELPQEQHR